MSKKSKKDLLTMREVCDEIKRASLKPIGITVASEIIKSITMQSSRLLRLEIVAKCAAVESCMICKCGPPVMDCKACNVRKLIDEIKEG